MAVHARVTGYVVEKFVKGGDQVVAGQPLYRIDSRQYESNVATAEANVARANADYKNAETDLDRYETLASQDAIARQRVDTQRSATEQAKAAVEAQQAALKIAQDNLGDTIIYAPYSGTLSMDAVDIGTFVNAGSTTLVTIDSVDPIFVEFSMTEQEYLEFMATRSGDENSPIRIVKIIEDGITTPRMDGTRGSALYAIPFQLSRTPSSEWIKFFLEEWEEPPRFTSMHRPGIASVIGNRIILDGTTIDEVKEFHRDTLKLCVNEANKRELRYIALKQQERERKAQQKAEHMNHVSSVIDEIEF